MSVIFDFLSRLSNLKARRSVFTSKRDEAVVLKSSLFSGLLLAFPSLANKRAGFCGLLLPWLKLVRERLRLWLSFA